uniref:Uncharacterized protein n=1 Tax=Sinocyclocheilus grahami TaxID=75366 RepID=A0A672Q9H4_SINGR
MARFLYRRKETFQPQEPKAGKNDDSPEMPFNTDPNSQSIISDNQKDYCPEVWHNGTVSKVCIMTFCFSGVIAVVIFVSLAALAVMARFLYRRKETFQPQEPKAGKNDDSPEMPFNTDPNSQSIISDNQKEYFI